MTERPDRTGSKASTWLGVAVAFVTFALIVAVLLQNLQTIE